MVRPSENDTRSEHDANRQRVDPYANFRFLIEIDGIVQAGFSECSGFGSSVEVIEYREGGDATTVPSYRAA